MKKVVCFLTFLTFSFILPLVCYAQFVVTPNGIKTAEGKNYIVIKVEGKDKSSLYNDVLKYISMSYVSPKDVISSVESEMISVNGISKIKDRAITYDMNYTIVFEFRDGRLKCSAPGINTMTGFIGDRQYELTLNEYNGGFGSVCKVGIFNKRGDLCREVAKESIETFFNGLIVSLQRYLSECSKEDDW